jgi:hypothetical protein
MHVILGEGEFIEFIQLLQAVERNHFGVRIPHPQKLVKLAAVFCH